MSYNIKEIADIINADMSADNDVVIEHLLTDSRKIILPKTSLFFALKTARRNGQDFIPDVYERRVRCFVVEQGFDETPYLDAVFLKVENVLLSLQKLAAHHRSKFDYPVIGITGSNGKTIVKEWLNELLESDYKIIRSPRSYN